MMVPSYRTPDSVKFRTACLAHELYNAIPKDERPKRGSWPARIAAMGFKYGANDVYCAHRDNINKHIPLTSNSPCKVIYIDKDEVARVMPHLCVCPVEDHTVTYPTLYPIALDAEKNLVNPSGRQMPVRAYGPNTRAEIRFAFLDYLDAFSYVNGDRLKAPSVAKPEIFVDGETGAAVEMVDFTNTLEIAFHFKARGCENADKLVEWVTDTVFNIQYGDPRNAMPQAAYVASVGSGLPREFSMPVCGVYGFTILTVDQAALDRFPALAGNGARIGNKVVRMGHTGCVKVRVPQHYRHWDAFLGDLFEVTHGWFWRVPCKTTANKVESALRDDVYGHRKIKLDGDPCTELLLLADAELAELQDEGQSTADRVIAEALDTSTAPKMRAEMDQGRAVGDLKDSYVERIETMRASYEDKLAAAAAEAKASAAEVQRLASVVTPLTVKATQLEAQMKTTQTILQKFGPKRFMEKYGEIMGVDVTQNKAP